MVQIEIKNLSKKYGRNVVLTNMTARFEQGIYGIAGPNGSGKSTLMKCLSALLRPDKGSVTWLSDGKELNRQDLYAKIGFSAPYIECYRDLSCRENLALVLELCEGTIDKVRVDDVLEKTGLAEKADAWYGNLSSGQQQRLKLATALIKNPEFLLLDEPGTNLDTAGAEVVSKLVREASEKGSLVIIASNNQEELNLCSSLVYVK